MTLRAFTMTQLGDQGWQKRIQMPVDKLLEIEQIGEQVCHSKSGIQKAFEYWLENSSDGAGLDGFNLAPIEDGAISLIDVTPDSPYHYRFSVKFAKYIRCMEDKRLAEFPYSDIIRSCSNEYYWCKVNAEPVGHHISHDLKGFRRDYLRLLLPLRDRSGRVSALACVSRHLDSPTPGGSLPSTPRG